MTDPIIDRVIAVLGDAPRVTLALAELAERVGFAHPDDLARLLEPDPRVLIIETPGFPNLAALPADRKAAYQRALRDAGLHGPRRVALLARPAPPAGAGIDALLRDTAARLLSPARDDVVALAAAAERANRVLRDLSAAAAAAPSTTPLPHPPAPRPAPPRSRPPAWRRPPRP